MHAPCGSQRSDFRTSCTLYAAHILMGTDNWQDLGTERTARKDSLGPVNLFGTFCFLLWILHSAVAVLRFVGLSSRCRCVVLRELY